MKKAKKAPSWFAVVLGIILFWPIGIYLFVKKMNNDDLSLTLRNSKILFVLGCVFEFMAFSSFLMLFDSKRDITTVVFGIVLFGASGAGILYASKETKAKAFNYRTLKDIVLNQRQTKIDYIAQRMGLEYEDAVESLQMMIENGDFEYAYIDRLNREIVFPDMNNVQAASEA